MLRLLENQYILFNNLKVLRDKICILDRKINLLLWNIHKLKKKTQLVFYLQYKMYFYLKTFPAYFLMYCWKWNIFWKDNVRIYRSAWLKKMKVKVRFYRHFCSSNNFYCCYSGMIIYKAIEFIKMNERNVTLISPNDVEKC